MLFAVRTTDTVRHAYRLRAICISPAWGPDLTLEHTRNLEQPNDRAQLHLRLWFAHRQVCFMAGGQIDWWPRVERRPGGFWFSWLLFGVCTTSRGQQ